MPYICSMHPEYDGVLQIKDLVPNKSQFNPTIGGRSKKPTYLNFPQYSEIPDSTLNGTNGLLGTTREMSGLAAFIFMESVTADPGWIRLWEANQAAYFMTLFTSLDFNVGINNDWDGGVWPEMFDLDLSNDRLRNGILAILGGAKYVVPAGTVWGDGNGNFVAPPTENFFVSNEAKIVGQYFDSSFNHGEIRKLLAEDNKVVHIWDDNGYDLTGVGLP